MSKEKSNWCDRLCIVIYHLYKVDFYMETHINRKVYVLTVNVSKWLI